MIQEYYYRPILVPPFNFFVYINWIIWKLNDAFKNSKKVCDVTENKTEFLESKKQDDKCNKLFSKKKVIPKRLNLISNWTNRSKFYG
jgi:hypothetical protein